MPGILKRIKENNPKLRNLPWSVGCDPMLDPPRFFPGQKSNPLNLVSHPPPGCPWGPGCQSLHSRLASHTDKGAGRQQSHWHMGTCTKGVLGKTGCRMCMPMGLREETSPVLLEPVTNEEQLDQLWREGVQGGVSVSQASDEEGSVGSYSCASGLPPPDHDEPATQVDCCTCSEGRGEGDKGVVFRVLSRVPPPQSPVACGTTQPLEKTAVPSVVVWETKRPPVLALGEDQESSKPVAVSLIQQTVQGSLADCGPFWKHIESLSENDLNVSYVALQQEVSKANGCVGTCNCATTLCTGSHNNHSLLGADVQAKGAVFYLCPCASSREDHARLLWQPTPFDTVDSRSDTASEQEG